MFPVLSPTVRPVPEALPDAQPSATGVHLARACSESPTPDSPSLESGHTPEQTGPEPLSNPRQGMGSAQFLGAAGS